MLLLNPIVRKTSEKRSRWWTKLAGFGLWSLLQPICMSLNIRSIKEEHDDVYTAPFLVALWHNRTTVPGYAWSLAQKPLKMCVLTSASNKSESPAKLTTRSAISANTPSGANFIT